MIYELLSIINRKARSFLFWFPIFDEFADHLQFKKQHLSLDIGLFPVDTTITQWGHEKHQIPTSQLI